MIGESSGLTTLINNERIYRNQPRTENRTPGLEKELQSGNYSDVTSFSAEALSLARNVVPPGGNSAEKQLEGQDPGPEIEQNNTARLLDILV